MYYSLLVLHRFLDLAIFSVAMEHDKSLIATQCSVYEANRALIDEWVGLESVFSSLFNTKAKVTKFVSPDEKEQVVQIEATYADAASWLEHPSLTRFMLLRTQVGKDILRCDYLDLIELTSTPLVTYSDFNAARAPFNSLVGASI